MPDAPRKKLRIASRPSNRPSAGLSQTASSRRLKEIEPFPSGEAEKSVELEQARRDRTADSDRDRNRGHKASTRPLPSRPLGRSGTEGLRTLWWREMDSNC